jgi:hypothetical protein
MNVKVQNEILNQVQDDILIMPKWSRHRIWALELT